MRTDAALRADAPSRRCWWDHVRCRPPSATMRVVRLFGVASCRQRMIGRRTSIQSGRTSPTDDLLRRAPRAPNAEDRLGPRARDRPAASCRRVKVVGTYVSSAWAVAGGVYLVSPLPDPILLAIGAASILAACSTHGGPRPYGYEGLGEVFVFAFLRHRRGDGLTTCRPSRSRGRRSCLAVPVGLLASAILVVNNVRDLGDRPACRQATLRRTYSSARRAYPLTGSWSTTVRS
jgi:hypothetical protein